MCSCLRSRLKINIACYFFKVKVDVLLEKVSINRMFISEIIFLCNKSKCSINRFLNWFIMSMFTSSFVFLYTEIFYTVCFLKIDSTPTHGGCTTNDWQTGCRGQYWNFMDLEPHSPSHSLKRMVPRDQGDHITAKPPIFPRNKGHFHHPAKIWIAREIQEC